MSTLIKNVTILDSSSPHHREVADIFIQRGKIQKIGKNLKEKSKLVIDGRGSFLSEGWVDCLADYCDPGQEHKENIESGTAAAKVGGFSEVFIVPNTLPTITNASILNSYSQRKKEAGIHLHMLGAISKNIEGRELTEMLEMHHSGAIAFTDGWQPIQDAQLLLKALEYVKAFDGIIVQIPIHDTLSKGGLMNEGETSVHLGMQGIPEISESLIIYRDLELLRYTESKIHFSGISTKKSLDLIKNAKKEGLNVTCSVTPYHLLFSDKELVDYDSNYKVNPPLRTEQDRKALIKGVKDGVIDCIATHHRPQDIDSKNKEFEYSDWGMNTQETCWSMLIEAIPSLSPEKWMELLSVNPRKIFNLEKNNIEEGNAPALTLFNFKKEWIYNEQDKKSKGVNNPLLNQTLKGKAQVISY